MDNTLACLASWMPRQRWYGAKGRSPHLRLLASWDLPSPAEDVRVRTYLVADDATQPVVLYQVPVVARATPTVVATAAQVIGSPEPGTTLIDGPHDPAYTAAVLKLISTGSSAVGTLAQASGTPAPGAPALADEYISAVLTGEQSNTSIIYRPRDGSSGIPVICKVFRQLHAGLNPDIELQTALASAGSPHVPRAVGSVEGTWPDTAGPSALHGSLCFAQEFLPGVEDAWRVALRAAADGDDFASRAWELGTATAEVHLLLGRLFATRAAGEDERSATRDGWHRRLVTAVAEVPDLAEHRTAIDAVYDRATTTPWPSLQRIHGDYHLGQVIQVPSRGWVLLDFEGEPLRPMTERRDADLALRDVAGMLRSFDYVAGSIRLDQPDRSTDSVGAWAGSARDAFLRGYTEASGADLDALAPLLEALELDKAVYETIYEARNRPTWVEIPQRAISRLIGATST